MSTADDPAWLEDWERFITARYLEDDYPLPESLKDPYPLSAEEIFRLSCCSFASGWEAALVKVERKRRRRRRS